MIPLADQHREPRHLFPYVSIVILIINVLVFLWMQFSLSQRGIESFFFTWGAVPARITSGEAYITLLTSMFIHGGWMHIIGNMLYLWIFGDNVESAMGHGRYLAFYLLTGVAAAFAQILIDPSSEIPAVGASGAIAGILGAYILFYPSATIKTLIFLGIFITVTNISALIVIGLWIVLQIVSGLAELGAAASGGVAYFAHIGGFIAGLVLANLFRQRRQVGMLR